MSPNVPASPQPSSDRNHAGPHLSKSAHPERSYSSELSAWLLTAREELTRAGISPEPLATLLPERRRWLLRRPATMRPIAQVWRLGVFLLSAEGELFSAGQVTRSRERGRQGYQSLSLEERRDTAAAAFRGGFPVGQPVNFDAHPLPLGALDELLSHQDSAALGPILIEGGRCAVRWRTGATAAQSPELGAYLRERLALLTDPPFAP